MLKRYQTSLQQYNLIRFRKQQYFTSKVDLKVKCLFKCVRWPTDFNQDRLQLHHCGPLTIENIKKMAATFLFCFFKLPPGGDLCGCKKDFSVVDEKTTFCLLDLLKHFPEDPIGSVAHPAHIEYKKKLIPFYNFVCAVVL